MIACTVLFLQRQLACHSLKGFPKEVFTYSGTVYALRPIPEDDFVFYDWIVNKNRQLIGLEIHLGLDDPLLESDPPIIELPYVDDLGFPIIWLGDERNGEPKILEAFGDIAFYGTVESELAIVVGTKNWIKSEEALDLEKRCPVLCLG